MYLISARCWHLQQSTILLFVAQICCCQLMSAAQYHNVMLSVTLKLCCQLPPAGQYHNAMLSVTQKLCCQLAASAVAQYYNAMLSVTQKLCCQLSSVAAAAQYFNAMLYGTYLFWHQHQRRAILYDIIQCCLWHRKTGCHIPIKTIGASMLHDL